MGVALRPGFSVDLPLTSRDAIEKLCAQLATSPIVLKRTRVPGGGRDSDPRDEEHLVLTVPADQQHFWSPWLMVELSPRASGAHLHAKFSPHPSVWTGFAFGYLTLGVVFAVALVIVASVALLPGGGDPSWAVWLAGGAAVAMVGMWWASQIGQRLAHAQMELLRRELERAIAGLSEGRASERADAG
jgi:hypothetical protein